MFKVCLCLTLFCAWCISPVFLQATAAQMLELAFRTTFLSAIGVSLLYLADIALTNIEKSLSKRNRRHTRTGSARREYTPVSWFNN